MEREIATNREAIRNKDADINDVDIKDVDIRDVDDSRKIKRAPGYRKR